METFCNSRYLEYWRLAMKSTTDAKKALETDERLTKEEKKTKFEAENKELIKRAAEKVGSISETELDIRFNADIFSPTVTHVIDETERNRQKKLIVDVAEFLLNEQIPAFVRECKEGVDLCLDTISLVDNLHHKVKNFQNFKNKKKCEDKKR